ncbi:related to WD repeat-containing protein YPL247C [Zygosaccharomyces bailii ISA1307]|nr:related to WD repeat-containing protein YPL247C [Zygosaccharomyces bailii ISA1307]
MDPFRGSKRSSISFGTYHRQPNHTNYVPGPYDNGPGIGLMQNSIYNGGSGTSGNINNNNGGPAYVVSRSPMYSPLDYSQLDYTQATYSPGYSPLHPLRSPGAGVFNTPICEYESRHPLFAVDWSNEDFVCLGSYRDGSTNSLQMIRSGDLLSWDQVAECNVTYPVSTIQWQPSLPHPRRFATCSDSLRIWNFSEQERSMQEQINLSLCKYNKQQGGHGTKSSTAGGGFGQQQQEGQASLIGELPPLTSFHWNPVDPNLLISSSIDTTCIVWDLQSSNYVRTQLIAHDSEVFDVRFLTQTTQLFASCGGDGSVRVFDLRCLAHSTIIYEPSSRVDSAPSQSVAPSAMGDAEAGVALLRLAPSPFDPNVIATFALDSPKVLILDMRNPGSPVLVLEGHSAAVNQMKWHPSKRNVLLSCSDDCQVLYWDLNASLTPKGTDQSQASDQPKDVSQQATAVAKWNAKNTLRTLDTPAMFYANGGQEVNNIVWRPQGGDWFGNVAGKKFQNVKL